MREIFADVYRFAAKWLGDRTEFHYTAEDFNAMMMEMFEIEKKYPETYLSTDLLMAVYGEIERRNKVG